MSTKHAVHASLPVRTVWVQESVFYDMDPHKVEWVKAKLIGLTILPGQVPLFEILTEQGALFSNVPPHKVCAHNLASASEVVEANTSSAALRLEDLVQVSGPIETYSPAPASKTGTPREVSLEELVYFNAPSETFSLCAFEHFKGLNVYGFNRERQLSYAAEYLASIDFYQDNNWCHMILRDDGFFAFMPSHKLLFLQKRLDLSDTANLPRLPDYKKLRKEFSL